MKIQPTILYAPLEENVTHNDVIEDINHPNQDLVEPEALRRSQKSKRSAILADYIVYFQESDFDVGVKEDLVTFLQAIKSDDSNKWIDAMREELKSMSINKVWDLVELPQGSATIGYKWIFKTKRDQNGKIDRFKARLVAKGFTQRQNIDYKETFPSISSKDSFRIIMTLVAHFNLELH